MKIKKRKDFPLACKSLSPLPPKLHTRTCSSNCPIPL